jgi:hypothetical protein
VSGDREQAEVFTPGVQPQEAEKAVMVFDTNLCTLITQASFWGRARFGSVGM